MLRDIFCTETAYVSSSIKFSFNFLISQQKPMLWVLKRTVSWRQGTQKNRLMERGTRKNRLMEMVLLSNQNTCLN